MNIACLIARSLISFCSCRVETKKGRILPSEILGSDCRELSKSGWSLGWTRAVDSKGRTIWIVDAHRDNGKRFVIRSDELLSAFLELERITYELAASVLLAGH